MSARKFRFPMFFKFLIGCLTLASLLIIGGTYVVKNETTLRSRGNYLAKFVRRLDGYVQRIGGGLTGTLTLLAADEELRRALDGIAAGGAPPPTEAPRAPGAVPASGAAPVQEATAAVAEYAKATHDALNDKYGPRPDVFGIFTADKKLVWAPAGGALDAKDLSDLAAVEKAVAGNVFAHRVQMLDGIPYQMSAVPVRSMKGGRVVGGMLIGVKLERYFEEWSAQTDEDEKMRFRPTLIDGSTVLATAWPADSRADLAKALQPDKIQTITVGQDTREVIQLKGEYFDYYPDPMEGYKGTEPGVVGRLVITRSRVNVIDPGARIPWIEIAVGVGLSLLIAFAMGFWITRPIKQMVKQSRDLLAGDTDLTQRIVVNSRDETADLADNINQVFGRVHSLATGVQSAAFQVGASSAEISAASREMLGGLKDQTLKIESSTTAVTELSASIQTVAGNAAQATEVAEQSTTAVNSAVSKMSQIQSSVDDAAEKMRELAESSKRIGNIVEVIRQISEQTSMLALNASIEAAHAGEQGRGFAVVADEVSSLARRVGQSAKDIEALIQTVKEQTQAAITSMERGAQEVGTGSEAVTSTLTGLGQLITVVKETATAVQEQAMVSDEIARNMDAVRHIATEVLSGSEESVVQAERLHELAFELEESIGGFNLDGTKLVKRGDNGGKRLDAAPTKRLPPKKPAPSTGASD